MSNKKAFSLIEVIFAITTIVAIAGVGSMLVRSYATAVRANQDSVVAAGLAQDLLSQSYLARYKNPGGPISVTFDKTIKLNNINYARELTIDSTDDASQNAGKYWQATAKIKWSECGKEREVIFKTDIARLGST